MAVVPVRGKWIVKITKIDGALREINIDQVNIFTLQDHPGINVSNGPGPS